MPARVSTQNWRRRRTLLGWVDLTDSGWFEWAGRVWLRCSVSKSPHVINSISVMFHFRFVTREQYPIAETNFPAAPESARFPTQTAWIFSSHASIPSSGLLYSQSGHDRGETRQEITLDAHTVTSHLTYAHSAHTEASTLVGILSMCRRERCGFLFIWVFVCCEGATVVL